MVTMYTITKDHLHSFLDTQFIKAFRFYKANYLGIQKIKQQLGDFDLVHVHILTRLGIIALYYKWFANKPFVVTEHWSRYLDLTGSFSGILRKAATKPTYSSRVSKGKER